VRNVLGATGSRAQHQEPRWHGVGDRGMRDAGSAESRDIAGESMYGSLGMTHRRSMSTLQVRSSARRRRPKTAGSQNRLVSPRIVSSAASESPSEGSRRYFAVNPRRVADHSPGVHCNRKPAITASESHHHCK
jgi:hypothetical protein